MKYVGRPDAILRIKIIKDNNCFGLSKSHYIENILKKFDYFDCCHGFAPFNSSMMLE